MSTPVTGPFNGSVKWFNATKGYGFIVPEAPIDDNAGKDVFVHISAVNRSGLAAEDLKEETRISFHLETRNQKTSAVQLALA